MGRKRKGNDGNGEVVEEEVAAAPAIKYKSGAWGMVGMNCKDTAWLACIEFDIYPTSSNHTQIGSSESWPVQF